MPALVILFGIFGLVLLSVQSFLINRNLVEIQRRIEHNELAIGKEKARNDRFDARSDKADSRSDRQDSRMDTLEPKKK